MGHPDGQNYAIWRGPDFFASQSAAIVQGTPIVAQGLITNFASVYVRALPITSHGVTVTVAFYSDATMAIQTELYSWDVPALTFLDVTIPAKGNFVKVTMSTTDPVSSNMTVAIIPTNNIVPHIQYEDQGVRFGNLLFSVPAGATTVFPTGQIITGRGWVYCQDVASSGKISYAVATLNINGAVLNNIIAVANPMVISFQEFVAPDRPLALRVTNNDGVSSHTASAYISVADR